MTADAIEYTSGRQSRRNVDLYSLLCCDDHVIDPDTCHQRRHRPQQLQQSPLRAHDQKATAPCRASVIYSKTVLILMRPEASRGVYVDLMAMRGKAPLMK